MATSRVTRTPPARRTAPTRRARTPAGTPLPPPGANLNQRLQWEYVDITDIHPYQFNPRDNEKAIPAVAASIRNYGFIVPVVLDKDNILIAGHTRVEAAKLLHMTEVPAVRAVHLNEDQVRAFRLIDNKVAEQASWDFDMLAAEISTIAGTGLDLVQFGWSAEELDCLNEVVADDCLSTAELNEQAAQNNEAAGATQRRAPTQARMVLGEIVFFLPIAAYRHWVDGLRQLHDFNEQAIAADIKQRLGILE